MDINDYTTGKFLGKSEIDEDHYNKIAQWPQGTVIADEILTTDEIKSFGITKDTIVYCD